jgi:hypothetical protein
MGRLLAISYNKSKNDMQWKTIGIPLRAVLCILKLQWLLRFVIVGESHGRVKESLEN